MPGLFGGSASVNYPRMTDEEKKYLASAVRLNDLAYSQIQTSLPAIYNEMGYTVIPGADTTQTAENPEYANIQNQIKNLQAENERIIRLGGNVSRADSPYRDNIESIRNLQSQLSSMSPTTTIGSKAPDTLARMTPEQLRQANPQLAADMEAAARRQDFEKRMMEETTSALQAGKDYEAKTRPEIDTLINQLNAGGNQVGNVAGQVGNVAGQVGTLIDNRILDAAKQRVLDEYRGTIPDYLKTQLADERRLFNEQASREGVGYTLTPTQAAALSEYDKRINETVQATMNDRLTQALNAYYTGVTNTSNLYGQQGNLYANQGNLYAQMGNIYGNVANLKQANMPGRYLATGSYAPAYQPYDVNYTSTLSTLPNLYGNLANNYTMMTEPYRANRAGQFQADIANAQTARQGQAGLLQTLGGAAAGAYLYPSLMGMTAGQGALAGAMGLPIFGNLKK